MKFETYQSVLDVSGNEGTHHTAVVACGQWQKENSAIELISKGAAQFLSALRPAARTSVSTAIWYHANLEKLPHYHDNPRRINHHVNARGRHLSFRAQA